MPNSTANFGFNLPLVNNATDADLWGGQLNSNWTDIDAILPVPAASKFGAVVVQSTNDAAFEIVSTQGSSGDVLLSAGADALPVWTTKAASDTVAGFVELATTAETQTGSSTTLAITPAGLRGAVGFSEYYQSSDIALSDATLSSLTHNLGDIPKIVQLFLVCQSADLNYSSGDVVPVYDSNNSNNQFAVALRAATIQVRQPASVSNIYLSNLTTGASSFITSASWKLRVIAWG